MKAINFNKIILLLLGLVVFNACVEDDDFDTPNTTVIEPTLDAPVISVDQLIDLYEQDFFAFIDDLGLDPNNPGDSFAIENAREGFRYSLENDNNYVNGYVVSIDEAGNWFEELIIQNRADQGSAGVRVLIDVNPLFVRYQFGQLVYVKVTGLFIGSSNGVITLGKTEGLEKIPSAQEQDFILRSPQVEEIVPTEISLSNIDAALENVYVRINNVQFGANLVLGSDPISFAGEQQDEFDGERILESCDDGGTIILSTSTFADFKSLPLPNGQGSLNGILTNDFFGEVFNIVINSPEDIDFGGIENRCDPGEFLFDANVDCDDTPVMGGSSVFSENFEAYDNAGELIAAGWTLINIGGGSYTWGLDEFSNNNYVIGNGFNSDEDDIDTWLISPPIDFDATSEDVLNFEIQTNFDGGEVMSVYVSTNFVDIESDSNWSLLQDVVIPSGPSGGFGTFQDAGPVNTSCINGSAVRLAFRYTGSDSGITTRYHVDNIEITGN